ncbi:hypothetical protein HK097_000424, partial [Rhizophlyctis rosea]
LRAKRWRHRLLLDINASQDFFSPKWLQECGILNNPTAELDPAKLEEYREKGYIVVPELWRDHTEKFLELAREEIKAALAQWGVDEDDPSTWANMPENDELLENKMSFGFNERIMMLPTQIALTVCPRLHSFASALTAGRPLLGVNHYEGKVHPPPLPREDGQLPTQGKGAFHHNDFSWAHIYQFMKAGGSLDCQVHAIFLITALDKENKDEGKFFL